jgi:hypothetical protein
MKRQFKQCVIDLQPINLSNIPFKGKIKLLTCTECSDVVCSDGVTISTAIPSVTDVVVKDIKTVPRLLEDNNSQVWLLDESLRKRPLNGTLCR